MTLPSLVYVNGEFVPGSEARISPFDRGFVFGDGVYEVIPVYGRRLFRLRRHLDRLDRSLRAIAVTNPLDAHAWERVFDRLTKAVPADDQYVYLQITRGVAPRDHAFPTEVTPGIFAYSQPLKTPDAAQLAAGVSAVTLTDNRWGRCDIKAIALLPNVLLRQQAVERGASEAILLRDGFMTEGAASNIFIVHDAVLRTPSQGSAILSGVTRDLILELARANGIACHEGPVSESDLRSAAEIWMTSSTKEILPVTRLDDKPVGSGRRGPLAAQMQQLYAAYKADFRAGRAE